MREADWPLVRQTNQLDFTYEQAQAYYIIVYGGENHIQQEPLDVALPVMAFLDWCCPHMPGVKNSYRLNVAYPTNIAETYFQREIHEITAPAVIAVPAIGQFGGVGHVAAVPAQDAVYASTVRYQTIHTPVGVQGRTPTAAGLDAFVDPVTGTFIPGMDFLAFLTQMNLRLKEMNPQDNEAFLLSRIMSAVVALLTRGEVTEAKLESILQAFGTNARIQLVEDRDVNKRIWEYISRVVMTQRVVLADVLSGLATVFTMDVALKFRVLISQANGAGASAITIILDAMNTFDTNPVWTYLFRNARGEFNAMKESARYLAGNRLAGYGNHAVGGWSKAFKWADARQAVEDPKFWATVDEERNRHLAGNCRDCLWLSMGKKEKKPTEFSEPKASRLIWYMWLGSRFLEFEALGFINEDHWLDREIMPAAVGRIPVEYLGNVLKDIHSRTGMLWAEDTAGWDTRVHSGDVDDEALIEGFAESEEHRVLINTLYEKCYRTKLLIVPRRSSVNIPRMRLRR